MRALLAIGCAKPRKMRRALAALLSLFVALLPPTTKGAEPNDSTSVSDLLADVRESTRNTGTDKVDAGRAAKRKAVLDKVRQSGFTSYTEDPYTGLILINLTTNRTTNATVEMLRPLDNIGSLTFHVAAITEDCFDTIATFKTLQILTIIRHPPLPISDAGIKKLAGLPRLRRLELDGSQITDEGLRQIGSMQTLEDLNLGQVNVATDKGFEHLAALPALKSLQIGGAAVTDDALQRLTQSKSLALLKLEGQAFSDEGLRFLGEMESLYSLMLTNNARITADGLRQLKSAPQLERLRLNAQLSDDSLSGIGELSGLRSLFVGGAITDEGLAPLNRLVNLRSLGLYGNRITGAGLGSLGALDKLTVLTMHGPKVSNAVFPSLHVFPMLREFNVGTGDHDGSQINDRGLQLIGNAPSLVSMYLCDTAVTPRGLKSLEMFPNLQSVQWGKTGVQTFGTRWRPRRQLGKEERGGLHGLSPGEGRIFNELRRLGVDIEPSFGIGLSKLKISTGLADDTTVALLTGLSELHSLILHEGHFTAASLDSIAQIKSLEELSLRNVAVSRAGIEKLVELPWLRSVEMLGDCGVTDETLQILKNCQGLERIVLDGSQITPEGVGAFGSFPSLRVLNLMADTITDEAIGHLSQSKSIYDLTLSGPAFTDEGLRSVASMANLHALTLENGKITAEGLRHLKATAALENLQLRDCPLLDDNALGSVAELTSLRSLMLSGNAVTDAGLIHLRDLTKLEELTLQNTRFTGAGLTPLAALPNLVQLTVEGKNVANRVFADLHQFPSLEILHVGAGEPTSNSGITDDGLKSIGNVPHLRVIRFNGTGVTNQGLIPLRALRRLSSVQLIASPGVTTPAWNPSGLQL